MIYDDHHHDTDHDPDHDHDHDDHDDYEISGQLWQLHALL